MDTPPAPSISEKAPASPAAAKPSGSPGLVRLRAGNGATHMASRATLAQSTYFGALLERWGGGTEPHELDVDEDSLATLLTLMRYGAEAVPSLREPLRVKVARDADYLGLPGALWAHLARGPEPPPSPANRRAELSERIYAWERDLGCSLYWGCGNCQKYLAIRTYHCVQCDARVDKEKTRALQRTVEDGPRLAHDCPTCGITLVRCKDSCCGCGHVRRGFQA